MFKLLKISFFFKKDCILLHYTPVLDSVTSAKSQIILKVAGFLPLFFSYSGKTRLDSIHKEHTKVEICGHVFVGTHTNLEDDLFYLYN